MLSYVVNNSDVVNKWLMAIAQWKKRPRYIAGTFSSGDDGFPILRGIGK